MLDLALPDSLEVPKDQLKLRLDFYEDTILMHVFEGKVTKTDMISAVDIAQAMVQELSISSGLLPEGALWWRSAREGWETALWRPPRVWKAALMTELLKPPQRFTLPMPGLIFVCRPGQPPYVYAAKKRPTKATDKIYHAPLFNLFNDGRSCPGTHHYPLNVNQVPESFFLSFFSMTSQAQRSRKYPDNLLKLWEELDGQKKYPMSDLVDFGKLEDIMGVPKKTP